MEKIDNVFADLRSHITLIRELEPVPIAWQARRVYQVEASLLNLK